MRPPPSHGAANLVCAITTVMLATGCVARIDDHRGPVEGDDSPGDGDADEPDDPGQPDAGRPPDAGEPADGCGLASSFGAVGALSGDAGVYQQDGLEYYELPLIVAGGPPDDVLWIELWEGFGVFDDQRPHTGTFSLTGDEAAPTTCGACVFLDADATATTVGHYLIASGGTLTISSLDGVLAGSLSDATFIEYDSATGVVQPGGCASSIASVSFSGAL